MAAIANNWRNTYIRFTLSALCDDHGHKKIYDVRVGKNDERIRYLLKC